MTDILRELSAGNLWCLMFHWLSPLTTRSLNAGVHGLCYYMLLYKCLPSWSFHLFVSVNFLFIHLRPDWHDAELMKGWKQSGPVDYLWVCLWPRVLPRCQCKKFTGSAVVWMLIALLEYQIQSRGTVRAKRVRKDSGKKVRTGREGEESNEQNAQRNISFIGEHQQMHGRKQIESLECSEKRKWKQWRMKGKERDEMRKEM